MDKKRKNQSNIEAGDATPKKPQDPNAEKVKGEFVQASLYQTKRENLLLGEFSADGKYSLTDDKLLQDLVTLPKVLQERVDNVAYAYSKYNGYNLNFRIDMDISESYCSAEIFLIEMEHGSDEDIKHLTSLGNFVEMYSPSFKDNVYKTWNINLQETPLDKDNIVFKNLWELESEYNFSKELIEILSQLYIVRLLKLLDGCGTLGLKIQGDYRALVEELIKKDPSLAQDHTRLKKILDQIIEKHNGFDVILSKPEGVEILKNFSEPITRVTGRIAPEHVEKIETTDAKPAEKATEKKAAPKKKKSKAKGGDSVKPFVWAIKNYNPQVLATPDEAKKILPSVETKAPVEVAPATGIKRQQDSHRARKKGDSVTTRIEDGDIRGTLRDIDKDGKITAIDFDKVREEVVEDIGEFFGLGEGFENEDKHITDKPAEVDEAAIAASAEKDKKKKEDFDADENIEDKTNDVFGTYDREKN